MPTRISQRLLSVLQLTRMALVFTALADSLTSNLLLASWHVQSGGELREALSAARLLATALMSIGMYGFGMSLNDIIDRRRDSQVAPGRPLPSGRIGVNTAHLVCASLGLCALIGGGYLTLHTRVPVLNVVVLLWTVALISFYDYVGKYLVAPGLLTLGLIRFFHASIAAPTLPLIWHPLLLMNHVTLVSTIGYAWEQKRPTLTRRHWYSVIGGLLAADALCIDLIYERRSIVGDFTEALWITPGLLLPLLAILAFVVLTLVIRLRYRDSRVAGASLMLIGLLWLIVYDAAFVAGYVSIALGAMVLMLLPVAYLSVLLMRLWSELIVLSQKPEYIRAR